jgi:hypothetical protein
MFQAGPRRNVMPQQGIPTQQPFGGQGGNGMLQLPQMQMRPRGPIPEPTVSIMDDSGMMPGSILKGLQPQQPPAALPPQMQQIPQMPTNFLDFIRMQLGRGDGQMGMPQQQPGGMAGGFRRAFGGWGQ